MTLLSARVPLLVLALVLLQGGVLCAAARTLAFYTVPHTETPPRLDGSLEDAAWAEAPPSSTYYEYFKPNPGLGELRTELRLLYDAKGLYLGIVNYDPDIAKIRATRVTRDDDKLWTDDCAEIYIDPAGLGVGYVKFVVNPIGTIADMKRIDAAVTLPNWSGSGWRAVTGKRDDAWVIEAFFPWSDLGREAAAGDLWKFCHVRYAYSTGKFQGVTWSPGGNYARPEDFGYLYFANGDAAGNLEKTAAMLARKVTAPWNLLAGDTVYRCRAEGEVEAVKAQALLQRERKDLLALLAEVDATLPAADASDAAAPYRKTLASLREKLAAVSTDSANAAEAMDGIRRLSAISYDADSLRWEARILQLLATL